MKKVRAQEIFWPISGITLCVLSKIFFMPGERFTNGQYLIAFYLIYTTFVLIYHKIKRFEAGPIRFSFFLIGVIFLLFSSPILENDHYRYLWEGRVLFFGKNPYLFSPNSDVLNNIEYNARNLIAYPKLTTVYPPLALLWFGAGGIISSNYKFGLIVLMIFNSVLAYIFLKKLQQFGVKTYQLVLIFPLIQKEYIQAIHIDFMASMFILPILLTPRPNTMKVAIRGLTLILASIWSKLLGGIYLISYLFFTPTNIRKKHFYILFALFCALSLPLFFLVFIKHFEVLSGAIAFSEKWIWNPGFYLILVKGLNIGRHFSRNITFYSYLIYLLVIIIGILKYFKQNGSLNITLKNFHAITYLVFSGMMFFSPVFNSWYSIWFLVPALLIGINSGVFYAIFSVFSYSYYWNKDFIVMGSIINNLWFLISIVEIYKMLIQSKPNSILRSKRQ